jgi:opacity protein-like surface antigen
MTLKHLLLGSVAFVALTAGSSAPAVAAPQPFNWYRCYVGPHVGYGWGTNSNSFGNAIASGPTEAGEGFPAEFGPFDHKTRGWVLGGQFGCNFQTPLPPTWFWGVEAEGWLSSIKGSYTAPEDEVAGNFSRFESRNLWDVDVALRLGRTWNQFLLYGKVGLAVGGFRYTETHDDFPTTHACFPCSVSINQTHTGLLLGLGWENAFLWPPNNHWTFKAEWNFINYGSANISYPSTPASTFPVSNTKHIIKIGLNYYLP